MKLLRAAIKDFRNLRDVALVLEPGGNLFFGPNAAGKTNLVEAIAFGATGRTLRSSPQRLLVCDQAAHAYVGLVTGSSDFGEIRSEVYIPRSGGRRYLLNQEQSTRAKLVTTFATVLFSEEDLETVRGPAARRRHFLNFHLAQASPTYYQTLSNYVLALAQRNALLRKGVLDIKQLQVWEAQLATYGAEIMRQRSAFVKQLKPIIIELCKNFKLGAPVNIRYRPNVNDLEHTEETLAGAQREARSLDAKLKFTTVGPHRDDLVFSIAGSQLLRYLGSAGQQRLFTLALKLAGGSLLARLRGESPLVMLDEPFAQLDETRVEALGEALGVFEQWLATGATGRQLPGLEKLSARRRFIEAGRLTPDD